MPSPSSGWNFKNHGQQRPRSCLPQREGGGPFFLSKYVWAKADHSSKRVPYSVQQAGGDDRCGRDKNGCDQVMQHAVGHVTLLGWLWIWKGQLRCSWYQSQQTLRHSSGCKLLVRRRAPEGKALTSATTPGPSLRLGALFPQAGCV